MHHPHISPLNRSIPAVVVIRMVVTWQITPTLMREATPNKHPLGRPPSAYEMIAVDTHCTRMRVLWGRHGGQRSAGRKAAVVRVSRVLLTWPCDPHPSVRGGAAVVIVAARQWSVGGKVVVVVVRVIRVVLTWGQPSSSLLPDSGAWGGRQPSSSFVSFAWC
jgi:hypothetical protein